MHALPQVLVVGSINVDITATADRLPTPGETIGGAVLTRSPGGKGANQAAAASRLGASVRMVGAVGDDTDGRWMREELREARVETDGIRTSSAVTGTALIVVDGSGENQIVVAPGANDDVRIEDVDCSADIVLAQLEIDITVVKKLAQKATGFVVVNAAPAQQLPADLLERVDLFIVNEGEYAQMPELAGAAAVAVTYGAGGAAMIRHGIEVARASAPEVAVPVSTVGAGDAFCSALALALASGLDDEPALSAACAVGAAAVRQPASQPMFGHLSTYA